MEQVEVDAELCDETLLVRRLSIASCTQCQQFPATLCIPTNPCPLQCSNTHRSHYLQVENLGLCAETVFALRKRGIQSLFPIQKSVFAPIMEGRDLIGRAKTVRFVASYVNNCHTHHCPHACLPLQH